MYHGLWYGAIITMVRYHHGHISPWSYITIITHTTMVIYITWLPISPWSHTTMVLHIHGYPYHHSRLYHHS